MGGRSVVHEQIINADVLDGLRSLPDGMCDMCVTSPPYYGLRDYGVDGQIGLEDTPEQYIQRLVEVFREVWRVLRDDGTLWLNLADTYAGSRNGAAHYPNSVEGRKQSTNAGTVAQPRLPKGVTPTGYKPKDLMMIPARVALALQADGWYLRQDIIWHKPNPMPESVIDRCTKAHEYIFLLSKSPRYYFDHKSIMEETVYPIGSRPDKKRGDFKGKYHAHEDFEHISDSFRAIRDHRNKRSVWVVPKRPFRGAHFAVFPPELVRPCILAGSRRGGIVLDPFGGSGTTGVVAQNEGRGYVMIELNPSYVEIAKRRIRRERDDQVSLFGGAL